MGAKKRKGKKETVEQALRKRFGELAKPLRDERVTQKTYWDSLKSSDSALHHDGPGLEELPTSNPDVFDENETPFRTRLTDEARARLESIEEAMETLSPQQRRVIQLTGFDGKSIDEAARVMGIAKGAAFELIKRARSKIQAYHKRKRLYYERRFRPQ